MASSARSTGLKRSMRSSVSMERPKRSSASRAVARSRRQSMKPLFAVVRWAKRRFSSTVSDGTRPRFWCTKLMPRRRKSPGFSGRSTASPLKSSRPPGSGAWKPARILTSVDLPEPFLPSRPCTSPGATLNETPASARAPPKVLAIPSSFKTGSAMGASLLSMGARSMGIGLTAASRACGSLRHRRRHSPGHNWPAYRPRRRCSCRRCRTAR